MMKKDGILALDGHALLFQDSTIPLFLSKLLPRLSSAAGEARVEIGNTVQFPSAQSNLDKRKKCVNVLVC
jgi:hypothetical protein